MVGARHAGWYAFLVLATFLAGCSDGGTDTEVDTSTATAEPAETLTPAATNTSQEPSPDMPVLAPMTPANVTHCQEIFAFFPVDKTHLQTWLPDGYTAGDLKEFLDAAGFPLLPGQTGQGVAAVDGVECQQTDLGNGSAAYADVLIYVQQPDLSPAWDLEPVQFDFYQPIFYTDNEVQRSIYDLVGFRAEPAQVTTTEEELPAGFLSGSMTVEDGQGLLASMEAPVSGSYGSYDAKVRQFHETETGTAFWMSHQVSAQELDFGPLASCTFRAGSPAAEVTGITSCTPGDGYATPIRDLSAVAFFHWVPGGFAHPA